MTRKKLYQALSTGRNALNAPRRIQRLTTKRSFTVYSSRRTDGVYKELTNQRVPTPWIEAFRRKQEQEKQGKSSAQLQAGAAQAGPPAELKPKRMKDSYFAVVSRVNETFDMLLVCMYHHD